jgi:hypothetical protein
MATAGGARAVVGVLAAAMAAWGCAAHVPAPSSGAPPVARAQAPAPAAPPRECGPTDRDYEAWFRRTFSGGYEVFLDGPDPAQIRHLVGEPKAEAERMLRHGLDACSTVAVSAIEGAGWRDLVPDLTRAVATLGSPEFRAHVIVALKALGSRDDFSDELIGVLGAGSVQARITAAMGARHFSLERFRGPLLDRVRQDPSSFVRYHAADSLFELADIYPRELSDHPALMAAMAGTVSYSRGTRLLTVGTFTLDTSMANVAVLSAGANGVVARYQQELGLTFARDGHPPRWTGMAFLDAQPEITIEVRKLLARVPELQGLVRGPPAGGASGD